MAAALVLLTACDVKRPREVLDEARMEAVLYDYHIAKVMAEEVPYEQAHRRPFYRQGVFVKHGISEAQFDSSMVWYTRHTDLLAKIYERLTKRFKQANDVVNDLIALRDMPTEEIPSGDSVKVWHLRRPQLLAAVPLSSRISFELTADTTFHERDSLCFQLDYRYHGLLPDTLDAAVMGLTIRFKNDSVLHTWQRLLATDEGPQELVLQSDTLGELRTVSGFVYLPNTLQATSLRLLEARVMRYHAKDSLQLEEEASSAAASSAVSGTASDAPSGPAAAASPQAEADSLRNRPSTPSAGQPLRETDRLRQRHTSPASTAKPATPLKRTPASQLNRPQRVTPATPLKKRTPASQVKRPPTLKRTTGSKQLQPLLLDDEK